MKILIIDNYDSFTYNLYQVVGELLQRKDGPFVLDVFRNDKITLSEIKKRRYTHIIISPGPGDPSDKAYFGICADVLTTLGKKIPVLGVCLGMQGMAHYFDGRVKRAFKPMHGKTSIIVHDEKGVFKGLPQDLEVMRYHSLVADRASLPKDLEITAEVIINRHPEFISGSHEMLKPIRQTQGPEFTEGQVRHDIEKGEIMGLRHKKYPIEGIQFHPESFATEAGKLMLENFLLQPLSS